MNHSLYVKLITVLRIRICMDAHPGALEGPDPHQSEKLDPDPDPHTN
jgi:hypothetical protein